MATVRVMASAPMGRTTSSARPYRMTRPASASGSWIIGSWAIGVPGVTAQVGTRPAHGAASAGVRGRPHRPAGGGPSPRGSAPAIAGCGPRRAGASRRRDRRGCILDRPARLDLDEGDGPPALLRRDRRGCILDRPARLDLDEGDGPPALHDQVDLAALAAEAPGEKPVALGAEPDGSRAVPNAGPVATDLRARRSRRASRPLIAWSRLVAGEFEGARIDPCDAAGRSRPRPGPPPP